MRAEIRLRRGEIGVEILHDIQSPIHPPPMTGIRADIRINARLRRRDEAQLLRLPRLKEPAGEQDFSRLRHVLPGRSAGLQSRSFRGQADFLHRPRLRDDQVMRHQVDVLEHDFHRLAGPNRNQLLVVGHLLRQRADADHPHAEFRQLRAGLLRRSGRQQRGKGVGEFQRVERRGRSPIRDGNLLHMADHHRQQRRR